MGHKAAILMLIFVLLPTEKIYGQSDDVALFSYSELMQLSPEKRMQYISDVQEMLVELSRSSSGHFSDSDPKARSRLKAWLEMMNREIKSAQAEEVSPVVIKPAAQSDASHSLAPSKPLIGKPLPASTLEKFVADRASRGLLPCRSKHQNMNFVGARQVPECTAQQETQIQTAFNQQRPKISLSDITASQSALTATESAAPAKPVGVVVAAPATAAVQAVAAQPGEVANPLFSKSRPISTIEKFVADRASRGQLLCRSKHQNANYPGVKEVPECTPEGEARIQAAFEQQRSKVLNLEPDTATSVASVSATAVAKPTGKEVSRKIPNSEIQALLKDKKNPASICDLEAKKSGTGPMDLVTAADGETRYCMTAKGEALYREGKLSLDGEAALPPGREARGGKPRGTQSSSEQPKAARVPAESTPVASKYACAPTPKVCPESKPEKTQVFAGNQTCIFAGMFSKLDSQNRKCESVNEFKVADISLKCGRDQAMCNPLLFGTTGASTPICIGRGQDATLQCSKLSSARDAEKFINRNVSGLQEKWDEFKKGLTDICRSDSPSAKFHCVECNIMEARLFEINARILGDQTCGSRSTGMDAVGSRIKNKTAPTRSNGVKK